MSSVIEPGPAPLRADCLYKSHYLTPQGGALNPLKRCNQPKSLGTGDKFFKLGLEIIRLVGRRCAHGRILEEKGNWDLKDLTNLLQPACPDAVHALLVFLHLLERETERVPQLLLAHCEHQPPHPHPAANVLVSGACSLLAHHSTPARHTHLPLC